MLILSAVAVAVSVYALVYAHQTRRQMRFRDRLAGLGRGEG